MFKNFLENMAADYINSENPDLHTAPRSSIIKSLRIRSDKGEKSKQIKETNTMG